MAVAVPVFADEQEGVLDTFGGQQEIIALKVTGGSFAQPRLVHAPDSPSPEVLTATFKLIPGLHPLIT